MSSSKISRSSRARIPQANVYCTIALASDLSLDVGHPCTTSPRCTGVLHSWPRALGEAANPSLPPPYPAFLLSNLCIPARGLAGCGSSLEQCVIFHTYHHGAGTPASKATSHSRCIKYFSSPNLPLQVSDSLASRPIPRRAPSKLSLETLAAREPCIVWKRSNGGRELPIRFPVPRRYRLEKKKIFHDTRAKLMLDHLQRGT